MNRESNWILIENRGSSSSSTSSSSSDRPNSKNSKVVSYIDGSFYHTFTNSGASQWRIEWNNADQTRLYFQSDTAVEARSLDRGFRIITNDINNSTMWVLRNDVITWQVICITDFQGQVRLLHHRFALVTRMNIPSNHIIYNKQTYRRQQMSLFWKNKKTNLKPTNEHTVNTAEENISLV